MVRSRQQLSGTCQGACCPGVYIRMIAYTEVIVHAWEQWGEHCVGFDSGYVPLLACGIL